MQYIFKRYEKKYLITKAQADALELEISHRMVKDIYDTYWVQNIYFDTDNWDVIRHSMEKPLYKEKLRLRCYGLPDASSNVFLELKKKYYGVVYKRRVALPIQAINQPLKDVLATQPDQIARELEFYMHCNPVAPKMYVAFHRVAFTGDAGMRITFDTDIHYRLDMLDFAHPGEGSKILDDNSIMLEVKTQTSIPMWLSRLFSEYAIYRTSFSKYGTCYTNYCIQKGDVKNYA